MKRKVRVAILGVMLHGTVHAAVQSTPVEPSLNKQQDKVADVQGAPATSKKNKVARGKKKRPAAKTAEAATPDVQQQGGTAGNSTDASEQTVQLRGVRG